MAFTPTALERAFELARTGDYTGVAEIRAQLHLEGYATSQLTGPSLLKQLRVLCDDARQAPDASSPGGPGLTAGTKGE